MLKRAIRYYEKVFNLSKKIDEIIVTDGYKPRAGAPTIFKAVTMMALCRLGSLNILEMLRKKTSDGFCGKASSVGGDLWKDIRTSRP